MAWDFETDPEFQKKMLDGGFAMMDVSYENMSEFMEARKSAYIEAAKSAGILE